MQTKTITVDPTLLPSLQPLAQALANYAWCYDPEAQKLRAAFTHKAAQIGRTFSERAAPASALAAMSISEQERLAADSALLSLAQSTLQSIEERAVKALLPKDALVAYFSAEYGVHEALPIYSGGLGILAGDHLKSASDLGLPLVAVGIFYRCGYHEQALASDHSVHERYLVNDPIALGAKRCSHADGTPLVVHVQLPGRHLYLQAWELLVGRTQLILMDSNLPQNNEADRRITERLYGGDHNTRIEQELALGVGGTFMLEALGKKPTAYHMNEGHAAFLTLARLHIAQRDLGLSLEEAHELVAASNIFTTHTPIAAGNDVFGHGLLAPYLMPLCEALRLPLSWVLDLGNEIEGHLESRPESRFSMTAFALRSAEHRNGVSLEHGNVSRRLWHALWPSRIAQEVPISAIVNGVHMRTWSHPMMQKHYQERLDHGAFWNDKRVLREALVNKANATRPFDRRFSADVLTLGFARRFAEYKRALLLFSDPERLRRLLGNDKRPVQLLFAGKAHPNNLREKANIQSLQLLIEKYGLEANVAFIENYDIQVARTLVQGVDVWLNLPRPPLEASGTSGMKVVKNGGLNLSVRDGWWKEAYAPGIGWAVGELYDDTQDDASRDVSDARDLYHLLEDEVAPLFYTRDAHGVPTEWIERCIASGKKLAGYFDATRMVEAYATNFYSKASAAFQQMSADGGAQTKTRVALQNRVLFALGGARVEWVEGPTLTASRKIAVQARILAPGLSADDIVVDALSGASDAPGSLPYTWQNARSTAMHVLAEADGRFIANAEIEPGAYGSLQVAIRVLPRQPGARMSASARFA